MSKSTPLTIIKENVNNKATNIPSTRKDLILIKTFQHHRNKIVREDTSPNKEFNA
jgi:hypothetical protein